MADSSVADVIREYARIGSRKDKGVILEVRNRLLQLGWQIHCTQDTGPTKYAYTSPEGKTYYSLKKLCQELASQSLISVEYDCYIPSLPDSSQNDTSLLAEQAKEGKTPFQQDLGPWISIPEPEDEADEVDVESDYCPQAVIDWYEYTGQEDYKKGKSDLWRALSLKAKNHLRAVGWTFWYADKKGRQELRYRSPLSSKNYYSLRMACKACMEEGGFGAESVSSNHHEPDLINPVVDVSPEIEFPSINNTIPSNAETGTIITMQTSMKKPGRCRKRKKESLCDDEYESWMMMDDSQAELDDDFSSVGGKRDRQARLSIRVRKGKEAVTVERNPRTVMSWLIDNQVVLHGAQVYYRNGMEILKSGRIFGRGIKCDCCSEEFMLSKFEAHAGSTKHRPSANIFLEDGRSLMDCQKEAQRILASKSSISQRKVLMNKGGDSYDQKENDIICSVCHYGGEIILCDRCPSSFHQTCLGITEIPNGDWFCPSCCCKICSQGRYIEDSDDSVDSSFLVCDQCERKYHTGCLKSRGCTELINHPNENWFCSLECENIFVGLQNLLGKPFSIGEDHNLTWTLLKTGGTKYSEEADTSDQIEAMTQIESKLNVALEVMHECFEPVSEAHTGRDLVEDVIFSRSSELSRLNFRGFYTAIVESNEEVTTVATVRIFGQKVAEVPLVATRFQFRRLGMCRVLMDELEKKLSDLGVERMILPAAHAVLSTWTNSFGFARMTDSERSRLLGYTFLDFQDTIMCHKPLEKHTVVESEAAIPITCIDQQNHLLSSMGMASCITGTCY